MIINNFCLLHGPTVLLLTYSYEYIKNKNKNKQFYTKCAVLTLNYKDAVLTTDYKVGVLITGTESTVCLLNLKQKFT